MKRAVKRVLVLVLVGGGGLLAGCDEMPKTPGVRAPRPQASAPAKPDPNAVDTAALAYVEAARAHAKTCICYSDPFEGLIRDYCDGAGPELDAVSKAGVAIAELASGNVDLTPQAAAFLREAELHARWLRDYGEKVERWAKDESANQSAPVNPGKPNRPETIRGAVPAFQTLARRYNEWHPEKKVSAIAYGAYRPGGVRQPGFSIERAVLGFYAVSRAEFERRKRETEYLPWIECFDGPCIPGY